MWPQMQCDISITGDKIQLLQMLSGIAACFIIERNAKFQLEIGNN